MTLSQNPCDRVIARLLLCTKRKRRPFSLVQVCDDVKAAVTVLGTVETVAEKVGISASMLRRFLLVDKLAPPLREMVDTRTLDSIDAVAELSALTESQQEAVAGVLRANTLDTEDIRGIVRLLNRNAELGIDAIVEKVRASKTTRFYVYEFVVRERTRDACRVREMLLTALEPEHIVSCDVKTGYGRIRLTLEGKRRLAALAREKRTTTAELVRQLLSEGQS